MKSEAANVAEYIMVLSTSDSNDGIMMLVRTARTTAVIDKSFVLGWLGAVLYDCNRLVASIVAATIR
jgi:hypothetical protein